MSSEQFERIEVYSPQPEDTEETKRFKFETQNESFRKSSLTWIALAILVILYPIASIFPGEDPTKCWKDSMTPPGWSCSSSL